jgi:hypothetical protein
MRVTGKDRKTKEIEDEDEENPVPNQIPYIQYKS